MQGEREELFSYNSPNHSETVSALLPFIYGTPWLHVASTAKGKGGELLFQLKPVHTYNDRLFTMPLFRLSHTLNSSGPAQTVSPYLEDVKAVCYGKGEKAIFLGTERAHIHTHNMQSNTSNNLTTWINEDIVKSRITYVQLL